MYAVVDKSKTSNNRRKDKAGTSGATKDNYGIFHIACRFSFPVSLFHYHSFPVSLYSLFLFFVLFSVHYYILIHRFLGSNRNSAGEMYAAVDKSLLKGNKTSAAVLDRDNTNKKGIFLKQIYNKLRFFFCF